MLKNKYREIFTVLIFNFLVYGCTPTLFESASGKDVTFNKIPLKVIKAIKDDDEIIVCVNVKDSTTENIETYNFSIPLYNINKLKSVRRNNQNYLTYEPDLKDVRKGCVRSNNIINVIEYKINDSDIEKANPVKKHKNTSKEIVYVIYRDKIPVQLGYISAKPIFNSIKSVEVPINRMYSYIDKVNSKPLLYLATPVTVAVDIIATPYLYIPFFVGYCLGGGDIDCQ
ncbi:hypothetical protein MNBD_GAMMA21-2573 [hydrothermal vent metagenome]|uniref:Lipoprotein n=1 Tax=hydrothermal vent metagenome TaxID=652676 RepID=A0A3B1AG12_9ZZZZ